jgi:uncharacterized protein (TIGR02996 family)
MSIEDAFLDAIADNPDDEGPRLIYADWLEERGDPRAEYLRLDRQLLVRQADDEGSLALVARFQELHLTIDPDWTWLVRRVPLSPMEELRAILSPPRRPTNAEGDWSAIEASLGLRLPADYKSFISTYGSGSIGSIEIESPLGLQTDMRSWWAGWAGLIADLAEFEDVPYPVFPEPGGLLPFGTFGDVDLLCWRTIGEPDQWPFVYHDRYQGFFEIKGLSAVEFLLEAVTQTSPLQIRLNRELEPPCDFVPQRPDPRGARLSHSRELDLDEVAARFAALWPPEQVRTRRFADRVRLLVEPLFGTIGLYQEGDGRTWLYIAYDQSCLAEAEAALSVAVTAGFTLVERQ